MQRAVRYLRYNADSLGLGGMDCIAASGFSGGSGTILGEVANLYGNVQPPCMMQIMPPTQWIR